jgi:hypothetical protein
MQPTPPAPHHRHWPSNWWVGLTGHTKFAKRQGSKGGKSWTNQCSTWNRLIHAPRRSAPHSQSIDYLYYVPHFQGITGGIFSYIHSLVFPQTLNCPITFSTTIHSFTKLLFDPSTVAITYTTQTKFRDWLHSKHPYKIPRYFTLQVLRLLLDEYSRKSRDFCNHSRAGAFPAAIRLSH